MNVLLTWLITPHIPLLRGRGIEIGEQRQRRVVDPDVLALFGPGPGCFHQQPAGAIVDVVRGGGRLRDYGDSAGIATQAWASDRRPAASGETGAGGRSMAAPVTPTPTT